MWKPLEDNCGDFGFIKAAFKGTFHSVLLLPSVNTCAVRGAVLFAPPCSHLKALIIHVLLHEHLDSRV